MTYKNSHSLKRLNKSLSASIPSHQNIASVLSSLFDISKEAVYRRLRGETPFSLDELLQLRNEYGLSLDELTGNTKNVTFSFQPLYDDAFVLDNYLKEILIRFSHAAQLTNCMTYNVCQDLPFFRQFGYPSLAAFKLFYWRHSILLDSEFEAKQFSVPSISGDSLKLASKINALYTAIPSTEIWNKKTVQGTLRQIEYFDDCGLFADYESTALIYRDLLQLVNDVIRDARNHSKLDSFNEKQGPFTLRLCDLSMENNSIYFETNKPVFLATGFNCFNSLQTTDSRILEEYKSWLNVMKVKSTTISGQAERIRHQFHKECTAAILKAAQRRLPTSIFEELLTENVSLK